MIRSTCSGWIGSRCSFSFRDACDHPETELIHTHSPTGSLASIHVRREALTIRVEVRDLPPLSLSQQGGEAGGSLIRGSPGRAGVATRGRTWFPPFSPSDTVLPL